MVAESEVAPWGKQMVNTVNKMYKHFVHKQDKAVIEQGLFQEALY